MASNCLNKSDGGEIYDTSIVSDISALNCDDFDLIIEHLLCKPKKSKRHVKLSAHKMHTAKSVPTLNSDHLFDTFDEHNQSAITYCGDNNASFVSLNDTLATVNSEAQFERIFAYFDENPTTDDLLLSDNSDDNEHHNNIHTSNETENIAGHSECQEAENILSNKTDTKEIHCKSKAILSKIQQFNGIAMRNNLGKKPLHTQNRPVSGISTSSTASVHDSDSDCMGKIEFKKPCNTSIFRKGNVRNKVNLFSDPSSSDRSSSASPSIQSQTDDDDDDIQFKRTQSKRAFKNKRDFFENFFQKKHDKIRDDRKDDGCTTLSAISPANGNTKKPIKNDARGSEIADQNSTAKQIDPHEKLVAVRAYVQTQYMLGRIQRLVTAISNLDEKRLSTMNLRMLKKFLTFLRDCSYNCTNVCKEISENVLNDYEKNVLSGEELLFSALKEAQLAKVYKILGRFNTRFGHFPVL